MSADAAKRLKAWQVPRAPLTIDRHVGSRLRTRRMLEGVSQTELAARVGVTFQQVQKYEKGTNRIAAGHLYNFAAALNCSPDYFYDELPQADGKGRAQESELETFMRNADGIQLCRLFLTVDDDAKKAVLKFMTELAKRPKK